MLSRNMFNSPCASAGSVADAVQRSRRVFGALRTKLQSLTLATSVAMSLAGALAVGIPATALAALAAHPNITAAISVDVFSTDPTKFFAANDYLLMSNIYESLYGHDEKGNLVPTLATGVEIKDDGLTYEFTLRPNVKFHNGNPFTAEDVRFSWQKAIDPVRKWPRAGVLAANIADVEIVGPLKVRIKLKKRDAGMMENLDTNLFMLNKKHVEAVGDTVFGNNPMGTGPFVFKERKIKEYIALEGFAAYWGKPPAVSKLMLRIVTDESTRLAQLQSGEVDIVDNVSPFLAVRMKGVQTLKVIQGPTSRNMYIMMNATGRNERMKNEEVRRALMSMVDTEKLTKSVYLGFAQPAMLNCGKGGVGCIGTPAPRIDAKQAREMLVKAGFDFSKPLNFYGMASGFIPQTRETVEALAQRFSEAGVQTKITLLEYAAWVQAEMDKSPEIDMIFCMFPDYSKEPSGRLQRGMRTGSQFSWYEDPVLDDMIDKMNDFTSVPAREKHISGIYQRINDKAAVIPLWATDMIYVARSNVEWVPTPNATWPVFKNIVKKAK
jgi:peptide/nickel transport system substrate-binding protein